MSTRKEILIALQELKLASARSLRLVVNTSGRSTILNSLSRLVNNGLVSKYSEGLINGRAVYYQLAQAIDSRTETARIMGCQPEDLIAPSWRGRGLAHTEQCLLLAANLRRLFPSALVLCDFEILGNEKARDTLLTRFGDTDLIPDVLVIFSVESATLSIAFEIECNRKSDQRVVQKLSRYAAQTRLDGIVYLCPADRLLETVRVLYRKRSLENAVRIMHYSDSFLLLGTTDPSRPGGIPALRTSDLVETNLLDWVVRLQNLKNRKFGQTYTFFEIDQKPKSVEKSKTPATCCPLTPSVTTPHLHSSNVALHAPVGSGHGRLVQQVAGVNKENRGKQGKGTGSGTGTAEKTADGILGSERIQGSKAIRGQIKRKTEQNKKEGPNGSGTCFDV